MRFSPQRAAWWSLPLVVAAVVVGLWHWVVEAWHLPAYLVPSPARVAQEFVHAGPELLRAWINTLWVTVCALMLAVILGVGTALVLVQSRWVAAALFPYAVLLQVTPIVAIAPLIIIWVQDPTLSLILCAALVALFPVISNTTVGLRSVPPGLMDYFVLRRATRWQILWRLRFPHALPYFFAGLRISSGLALIGAVVAEFVAGTAGTAAGLAYEILQGGFQLNIARMFAALGLIALTGVALFGLAVGLARWSLQGWHDSEMQSTG